MTTASADHHARANDRDAEFLALLGQHEFRLAACIHAMVPGWQDAEDVLQETKVALWRGFDEYQTGSDFMAWALRVARCRARALQRKRQRERLLFSDELVDALLELTSDPPAKEDRRLAALLECSKRLGPEGWELFRRCYGERQKIKQIAAELGRSVTGTYGALSRLRRRLAQCIEERLRRTEAS